QTRKITTDRGFPALRQNRRIDPLPARRFADLAGIARAQEHVRFRQRRAPSMTQNEKTPSARQRDSGPERSPSPAKEQPCETMPSTSLESCRRLSWPQPSLPREKYTRIPA